MFDTVLNPNYPNPPRGEFTKLYLSNNPLPRAPGAIFNLQYLSVLSLRNTQITELPPSIGNLRNLQTLNLSLTRLRYLPGELLNLMKYPSKLQTLTIRPNPFYRADCIDWDEGKDCVQDNEGVVFPEDLRSSDGRMFVWHSGANRPCKPFNTPEENVHFSAWNIRILARSPVQFSDSRGVIVSKFQLPQLGSSSSDSAELPSDLVIETEDLRGPVALPQSKRNQSTVNHNQGGVPSLFELALQACSRSGQLQGLSSYLPPNAPSHLTELLDEIATRSDHHDNDSGDLPCSICGRRVMVPVAQWIEWYKITKTTGTTQESSVPFLRRGCSWKCLPRPVKPGESLTSRGAGWNPFTREG